MAHIEPHLEASDIQGFDHRLSRGKPCFAGKKDAHHSKRNNQHHQNSKKGPPKEDR